MKKWKPAQSFACRIALVLLVVGLSSAVRATVGTNLNLSKLTGYQGEATIAIDPTNANRMFASSNMSSSALFAAYSTDGGTTWLYTDPADKTIADGGDALPRACCDASAVFDKFGNLYLTYLTNSPVNVVVALSTNGGQSFTGTTVKGESSILGMFPLEPGFSDVPDKRLLVEKPEAAEEKDADALNAPGDQPTVAAGPSFFAGEASVWVSWNNAGMKAAGTRATGLGAVTPFSTIVTVPTGGSFGDLEIGPSGQVLVMTTGSSGQGPVNINASLDPDGLGPAIFELPVFVTTNKKETFPTILDVFGASVLITSTNVGGFDVIPAQPNRTVDAEPDLAWDRTGGAHNGRVYIAYTEEPVNENNDTDIRLRFSDNNGATWSAPVRVNDDATTRSQFFPRIEVDQTTGGIAVAFYDCRNDAAGTDGVANTEAEVYGAVSFNGGTSFRANEKISTGSSRSPSFGNANEYGDYNGLAYNSGKYFYIWSDNSNSTSDNPNGTRAAPDIYTAKVTVAPPTAANVAISGRVLTADGRGLQNATVTLTDSNGGTRTVRTGSFGYYDFANVEAGQLVTLNVVSKRFQFNPQVISINDNIQELNFIAVE